MILRRWRVIGQKLISGRKATLQKGYSRMCSGYPQSGAQ
jgi:hypothetical protein